jgi:hypothetical protein
VRIKTLKETSSTREKEAKGRRLNVIELDKDENGGRKKEDAMSMYIFLTNRKRNQSNST